MEVSILILLLDAVSRRGPRGSTGADALEVALGGSAVIGEVEEIVVGAAAVVEEEEGHDEGGRVGLVSGGGGRGLVSSAGLGFLRSVVSSFLFVLGR